MHMKRAVLIMNDVNLNTDAKVIADVQSVLDKAKQIKQRFADSLSKAQADAEALEEEVAQLEAEEQEIYSLYVMDEVDLSAYNNAKKATEEKRSLLTAIQSKIASIDSVEKQELARIYKDDEPIRTAFNKEMNKADNQVDKLLLQAKYDYMQQVIAIASERRDIYWLDYRLNQIKLDAGLSGLAKQNYTDFHNKFIPGVSQVDFSDHNIGISELHNVYRSCEMDNSFKRNYEKAMEK